MREQLERKIEAVDQGRHVVRSWLKAIVKEAIEEERTDRVTAEQTTSQSSRRRLAAPLLLISGIAIGILAATRLAGHSGRGRYSTPGRSGTETNGEETAEDDPELATDSA